MTNFDDLLSNTPDVAHSVSLSKEEYANKKRSEREDIFNLSDNIAFEVAGDSAMFKQYLDTQCVFSRYSAVNTLLIMAQNPTATSIASFDTWKERGGFVKSGEAGISILEPHEYTKDDGTAGTGYNIKKVFDISQIDTRKIKAAAPAPIYTERQLLGALISKCSAQIMGVDELPDNLGAMTDPDGSILVRKGMGFSDTFRALAYEIARTELPPDSEFSAYCAAYLLCKKFGADTREFDFSNIGEVFAGTDAQQVKAELTAIRDIADSISGRMAKHLEPISKETKIQEAR